MSIMRRRRLIAAALALGGGMVFQYLPQGCFDYTFSSGVTAFDVCSVLNCTGGAYFDFCNPVPLFLDCPTVTTTNP